MREGGRAGEMGAAGEGVYLPQHVSLSINTAYFIAMKNLAIQMHINGTELIDNVIFLKLCRWMFNICFSLKS